MSAKTSHGPAKARNTPPIAGPANMPTLEIVLSARFDAVSSSGVVASVGSNAASAGLNAVEITDDEDRERVDDERRPVCNRDHGHAGHEGGARDVDGRA